jgi:thiol:disulfide interchange protein DsbA
MKKRTLIPFMIFALVFLNACQSSEDAGAKAAAASEQVAKEMKTEVTDQATATAAGIADKVVTQAQEKAGQAADKMMQKTVPYEEGIHYSKLTRPYDTGDKDHVVVYEFFGYTCPHCNNFQPYMNPWHKKFPKNVKLVRVPVVFHPTWEPYARAYHTAEMMGLAEKTHQAMFDAIHKERKRMRTIEDIAQWYHDKFGVNKDEFLSTAKSFAVESKMGQAERMREAMNVTSTPTLVIDGKYKPIPRALGSHKGVIQASDYLVQRSLQEKGLAGK